jgi:radical SAM/Cys-rich protein
MLATRPLLKHSTFPAIKRGHLDTLQVNLGYLCNQSCQHCHVNAGPKRREIMSRATVDEILAYLKTAKLKILDLTGGAPELNPNFRYLLEQARKLGLHVIDRCNLTILHEPEQEDLAECLAQHQVEIISSLPCYLAENVDTQRGKGVYDASIAALQMLNALGYGIEGSGLTLNLVYNPTGACLPPSQAQLKADYQRELGKLGIRFNDLYTLTNMPIQRFGSTLISKGEFDAYMTLLKQSHQDANLANVMCRSLISVDWQGYLYDCDFNQMLDLPMTLSNHAHPHIRDIIAMDLSDKPITIGEHCYACTAGQGSSCGGALG